MKHVLIILLIFVYANSTAQGFDVNDTMIANNGREFYNGQKITLNYGSDYDSSFRFVTIYKSGGMLAYYADGINYYAGRARDTDNNRLPKGYANKEYEVYKIVTEGSKKRGYTDYLIIKTGDLYRYKIDINNALKYGEVK